jgi:hypothetical protein
MLTYTALHGYICTPHVQVQQHSPRSFIHIHMYIHTCSPTEHASGGAARSLPPASHLAHLVDRQLRLLYPTDQGDVQGRGRPKGLSVPCSCYLIEWPYMQIAPDNSLQVCLGALCEYNADYVDMWLVVWAAYGCIAHFVMHERLLVRHCSLLYESQVKCCSFSQVKS